MLRHIFKVFFIGKLLFFCPLTFFAQIHLPEPTLFISMEFDRINPVSDPDGKSYKTISLLKKLWLAENLNYEVANSWCYDNSLSNCRQYGRLYTWKAATEACSRLGTGWRLPTNKEWNDLAMHFGGTFNFEGEYKSYGDPNKSYSALLKNGNSGFSALLGGVRKGDGQFLTMSTWGYYWSSSQINDEWAWSTGFDLEHGGIIGLGPGYKPEGFSCRCVKD